MDKNLRLLSAHIISESQLSKTAKLQLLNFIKEEASDAQVKALLMDGEVVKLDDQAEEIVNDRFDLFIEKKNLTELSFMGDPFGMMHKMGVRDGFIAAAFVGVVAQAGEMAYKRFFSKAARACKDKSGTVKTACMNKFKIDGIKEKIKVYQKGLGMCSKSKTPDKCKAKLQSKIAKAKAKLGQ